MERGRRCAPRCAAGSAPAPRPAHPDRAPTTRRALLKSSGWGGGLPELGRVVRLVPSLPAPDLLLSPWDGVVVSTSLPGPLRRSAVHAARTGVTVAAAFERRWGRCQPP